MPGKLPHCDLVLGRVSSALPLLTPPLQPHLVSVVFCAFWRGAWQPGNTCPFSPILQIQPKRSWESACAQPSILKAPQAADGHKQQRVYFRLFCRVWTCGPALHFIPKIQSKTVLKKCLKIGLSELGQMWKENDKNNKRPYDSYIHHTNHKKKLLYWNWSSRYWFEKYRKLIPDLEKWKIDFGPQHIVGQN